MMESLGSFLKQAREKQGIRLEEIASITKIHVQSLERLEAGQWEGLPPEPFIRGFITAYAKYVGVDPKVAIEKYVAETQATGQLPAEDPPPVESSPTPTEPEEETEAKPALAFVNWRAVSIFLGILGAGAIVYLIYLGKKTGDRTLTQTNEESTEISSEELSTLIGSQSKSPAETKPTPSPPPTEATPSVPAKEPTIAKSFRKVRKTPAAEKAPLKPIALAPMVTQPPPPPPRTDHTIVVKSGERSWVKVVVDDKQPIEFFLAPSKEVSYTAKEKIKIILGNPTGAAVLHNGVNTKGNKYRSGVYAYVFPKGAKFPQDKPVARPTASEAPPSLLTESESEEEEDDTEGEEDSEDDQAVDMDASTAKELGVDLEDE